jgi:hypothetical protein
MEGKTALGASSPAKPALHIPLPLSTTSACTSSSACATRGEEKAKRFQGKFGVSTDATQRLHALKCSAVNCESTCCSEGDCQAVRKRSMQGLQWPLTRTKILRALAELQRHLKRVRSTARRASKRRADATHHVCCFVGCLFVVCFVLRFWTTNPSTSVKRLLFCACANRSQWLELAAAIAA